MEQPLLADSGRSRTYLPRFLRRPPQPPADPSPEALAKLLRDHNVHRTAAKQLDSYARAEAQHRDELRAKLCLMLGTTGLVLGLTPSIPAVYSACRAEEPGWDCGLRATALVGGFLALSGSIITGWALWHHESKMAKLAQRLSETLTRAQEHKSGEAAVGDLFHRFRGMTRQERSAFTEHLHNFAREPRGSLAQAGSNLLAV